jgi:hypothetical protein
MRQRGARGKGEVQGGGEVGCKVGRSRSQAQGQARSRVGHEVSGHEGARSVGRAHKPALSSIFAITLYVGFLFIECVPLRLRS